MLPPAYIIFIFGQLFRATAAPVEALTRTIIAPNDRSLCLTAIGPDGAQPEIQPHLGVLWRLCLPSNHVDSAKQRWAVPAPHVTGEIRTNRNQCLIVTPPASPYDNGEVNLEWCDHSDDSQDWAISADGAVMISHGRCLAVGERLLDLSDSLGDATREAAVGLSDCTSESDLRSLGQSASGVVYMDMSAKRSASGADVVSGHAVTPPLHINL
jgi:hypothetical protein